MGKPPQTTTMDKVRAAVLGASGRGSLYRWMRLNHDEFDVLLKSGGRPNWAKIASAFCEDGLTDAWDKPPTAERARQTWFKVRADVALDRTKRDRAQKSSGAISNHARETFRSDPAPEPAKPDSNERLSDVLKGIQNASKPWEKNK